MATTAWLCRDKAAGPGATGGNKDLPQLYDAWFYLAMDGRSRMADLPGDRNRARRDREIMHDLRYATESGYRSPGHDSPTGDRGNALAVVAGIDPVGPAYG